MHFRRNGMTLQPQIHQGLFFVFVHFFVVVVFLLVHMSDVILNLDCQTYQVIGCQFTQ